MNPFLRTTSLLAIAALFAAPAASAQPRRPSDGRTRIDTTFAFDKAGDVTLSLVAGEIRVTGWARDEIRVVAVSERADISVSFARDRLRLQVRAFRGVPTHTRYDISVPFGVRVDATTAAGNINIAGTRGRVSASTVSGTIVASDVAGRAEIESAQGGVTLQRFAGTTRVSALSGPVTISEITGDLETESIGGGMMRIDHADLTSLRYKAVAAHLDFDGSLSVRGRHSIETLSGNVMLRVPADFGATIELTTLSGELRAPDFPLVLRPSGGNSRSRDSERREYSINGGGANITIDTFTGTVTVRKRGTPGRSE